jgi:hypothetical protein
MRQTTAVVLAAVLVAVSAHAAHPVGRGFVLAGEIVRFDPKGRPVFTMRQQRVTASETREGFTRWASTAEGRRIVERLTAPDREVVVTESSVEPGIGRAPQPGFLTLLEADEPATLKRYELILNPTRAREYDQRPGVDLGYPRTPGDVMALAWAGEMLHVDFYAMGIPLPHHRRVDFQERWAAVARQLGFPRVTHGTDQTEAFSRER